MLNISTVITAALLWLALLFAVAVLAERRPTLLAGRWEHVYALSLAVHCTSWAFYGTVAQAARHGWPVPPTFVGAMVVYVFGSVFWGKLVRLAREQHSTSLADFIATRLGRDAWLAAVVTLVAVLGLIPYIALQLQAITMSFVTLTGSADAGTAVLPPWRDGALYLAVALALFTMLFGTRRASVTEHNRALVLAIAFESVFKLLALLTVGVLAWWGLGGAIPAVSPPAGLLQAYRFIADTRDEATGERLDNLEDPYRLFRCHTIMNCADVCPKGLNPTAAIGKIKELLVRRTI